MSADFWAGYLSGAAGILVGNPLDIVKTRLQAGGNSSTQNLASHSSQLLSDAASVTNPERLRTRSFDRWTALARGAAAPILGYGALNALLFVTYNRSLALLSTGIVNFNGQEQQQLEQHASAWSIWAAGALGGLATFVVSAPTELVKCRAQVAEPARSSWDVARDLWRAGGLRGLYLGGGLTSLRDGVGYGFYFWSYHLSKQALAREGESENEQALKVLLCGGLAGVVTWASVFPLDVIKTRVQTYDLRPKPTTPQAPHSRNETSSLLQSNNSRIEAENVKPNDSATTKRPSTLQIAGQIYRSEGLPIFFRGLGICSARAFIVNAIQWAMYEWIMRALAH